MKKKSPLDIFLSKFEPADVLAIILVIGYIALNWKGVQTMLTSAVMLIVGWYFAHRTRKDR